jgi:signal transduction histidine kinase
MDENFRIYSDIQYFNDLFTNLIDNALKYSPNGGKITIEGTRLDNFIQISINDEGIGLSIKELEHVFDDFYKADWSRHDLTSSGLGLTICKKIIEKHNGKIWAESKGKDKGSSFIFTLPIIKDIKNKMIIEEETYEEIDEVIKNHKNRLK